MKIECVHHISEKQSQDNYLGFLDVKSTSVWLYFQTYFLKGRGHIVCLCPSLMPSVVSEHLQNYFSFKGSYFAWTTEKWQF